LNYICKSMAAVTAGGVPARDENDAGAVGSGPHPPPPSSPRSHPPATHALPHSAGTYTLTTTPSHDGAHLCAIHCVARFEAPVRPATVWGLLTHPGTAGAGLWRDVKAQTHRVVEAEEGVGEALLRTVTVTQVGEVRLAFKALRFETHLRVVEDGRRAGEGLYTSDFGLARPGGALRRFHGVWTVRPGEGGRRCVAVLDQDVCPAGVPPGLNAVPVVGRLVRGACSRAVRRMVEDLAGAAVRAEALGGVDALIAERAGK
jgi:hypothetical protein